MNKHPCTLESQFDSDSRALMTDNGASASITNTKSDFVNMPLQVNRRVCGIKGNAQATHVGTARWKLEDDQGRTHSLLIQGTFLIPNASARILSPQHLAQQVKGQYPIREGTGAITTSTDIMLLRGQCEFQKTVPLDSRLNTGLMTMECGVKSYCTYHASSEQDETLELRIFEMHIIPETDEDLVPWEQPSAQDNVSLQPINPVQQVPKTHLPFNTSMIQGSLREPTPMNSTLSSPSPARYWMITRNDDGS